MTTTHLDHTCHTHSHGNGFGHVAILTPGTPTAPMTAMLTLPMASTGTNALPPITRNIQALTMPTAKIAATLTET